MLYYCNPVRSFVLFIISGVAAAIIFCVDGYFAYIMLHNYTYAYTALCAQCPQRPEKGITPPERELQMVVNHHVGVGN